MNAARLDVCLQAAHELAFRLTQQEWLESQGRNSARDRVLRDNFIRMSALVGALQDGLGDKVVKTAAIKAIVEPEATAPAG